VRATNVAMPRRQPMIVHETFVAENSIRFFAAPHNTVKPLP
jgi:hypothetical protein